MEAEPLKAATVTCIPRLRGGSGRRRSAPAAASVSVMDRLRDVLLRLAMLSAASSSSSTKAGTLQQQQTTPAAARMNPSPKTTYPDTYRSEAVDECIEFLKQSAAGSGGGAGAAVEVSSPAAPPLHA